MWLDPCASTEPPFPRRRAPASTHPTCQQFNIQGGKRATSCIPHRSASKLLHHDGVGSANQNRSPAVEGQCCGLTSGEAWHSRLHLLTTAHQLPPTLTDSGRTALVQGMRPQTHPPTHTHIVAKAMAHYCMLLELSAPSLRSRNDGNVLVASSSRSGRDFEKQAQQRMKHAYVQVICDQPAPEDGPTEEPVVAHAEQGQPDAYDRSDLRVLAAGGGQHAWIGARASDRAHTQVGMCPRAPPSVYTRIGDHNALESCARIIASFQAAISCRCIYQYMPRTVMPLCIDARM